MWVIKPTIAIHFKFVYSYDMLLKQVTKQNDYRETDVANVLGKRGQMSKAPTNTCGCQHHSMIEMTDLNAADIDYYTAPGEVMHNIHCSNPGCKNGPLSKNWPRPRGFRRYGVYCSYVTRGESSDDYNEDRCTFVCCNECAIKRLLKEEELGKGGTNGRSRRKRKRDE